MVSYRELANDIKATANDILYEAHLRGISQLDTKMLTKLISYMDKFLLECLKDNKLVHKFWISARLVEVEILLKVSKDRGIQRLLIKVAALQRMLLAGETNGTRKTNSGGHRPPLS